MLLSCMHVDVKRLRMDIIVMLLHCPWRLDKQSLFLRVQEKLFMLSSVGFFRKREVMMLI